MGIIVLIKRDMKVQQKRICDMSNFKHNLDNSLNTIGSMIGGTYLVDNPTTIPSNTWYTPMSITLDKGIYIVSARARFGTNPNGYRCGNVRDSADNVSRDYVFGLSNDGSSDDTYITIKQLTTKTTLYFNICQTSGEELSLMSQLFAVKLK